MLNGKSYLISITALFSKKGYEVAVGVDTPFDDVRDTQYHLTAPAISTYRALKMDELKSANRLPYAATSLFGGALYEASITTEVEGVEMESVVAVVADYLAEIQRQLSGESGAAIGVLDNPAAGGITLDSKGRPETALDARRINPLEDIEAFVVAFESGDIRDEAGGSIDFGLSAESYHSGGAEIEEHLPGALNKDREIKEAEIPDRATSARNLTTEVRDAEVSEASSGSLQDASGGSIDEALEASNNTAEEKDAEVVNALPAQNLSLDRQSVIDYFTAAGNPTHSREAEVVSAVEGENDKGGEALVEVFTEGSSQGQVESVVSTDTLVEVVKGAISDSPEVQTATRLFEIMYGRQAAETIQAGMSSLVNTWVAEGEKADAGSVTDAVVARIKEAASRSSNEAVEQRIEQASSNPSGQGIHLNIESAQSNSSADGVYHRLETAQSGASREAEMTDIGRAIAEANRNLLLHNPTLAGTLAFGEGVMIDPETAESNPTVEAAMQDTERADSIPTYSAESYDTETARAIDREVGVHYETETAHRNMVIDAQVGTHELAEQGANKDAIIMAEETAGRDEVYLEAVESGIEGGEKREASREAVLEERYTEAENIPTRVGQLDEGAVEGSADITLNAKIEDMSKMYGDNVYDAEIAQFEDADTRSAGVGVIEEHTEAESMDSVADTLIEPMTEAESRKETIASDADELVEGVRKKKVLPTDIVKPSEPDRKKKTMLTVIEGGVEVDRAKRTLPTAIEQSTEALRPKKTIPTKIEEPSEGTHKTPPEDKKGKIWLIMGKIASWSIWNWKKTR